MEYVNPVAAASMAAVAPDRTMSPVELNSLLVGPGGKAVSRFTLRRRLYALVGWTIIRASVLFLLLVLGSYVTLRWPEAPWVKAAQQLLAR